MKPTQLIHSVRSEVSKPFQEKLRRAKELVKLFANSPKACVSCSFGKDSLVVAYLALEENPKISIVFENTLSEFPETMKLARTISTEWNYTELRPASGVNFWKINDRIRKEHFRLDDGRKHSNICCYHLKERPFAIWRKQQGISLSFTGITATESRYRMFVACKKGMEYYSSRDDLHKVHPIMFWTSDEVWQFTKDHGLPINEAYGKYGIDRLGCMWCMSHRGWRAQVAKINPKVYCYMMRRYFGTPSLLEVSQ